MLLAHAGNRVDPPDRADQRFPAANVADVRRRVGRLLDALRPEGVVSAPAAGADLIVLEAAAARGIPAHVVLPLGAGDFEAASVADLGPDWVAGYRHLVDRARHGGGTIVEIGLAPDGDWYEPANRAILDRARALAASAGEALAALAIRPPLEPDDRSVTDDFAARARRAGIPVLDLDPSRPLSAMPRALVVSRWPGADGSGGPGDGVVDRIVVPALEDADLDWAVVPQPPGADALAGAAALVLPSTGDPSATERAADLVAGTGTAAIVLVRAGAGAEAEGRAADPVRPGRPDVRLFGYPLTGRRVTDREAMSAWPRLAALLGSLPSGTS